MKHMENFHETPRAALIDLRQRFSFDRQLLESAKGDKEKAFQQMLKVFGSVKSTVKLDLEKLEQATLLANQQQELLRVAQEYNALIDRLDKANATEFYDTTEKLHKLFDDILDETPRQELF